MLAKQSTTYVLAGIFFFLSGAFTLAQETARFTSSGQFALGTDNPDAAAIVEFASTDMGVLIPRMTTAERDDIPTPPEGLLIYNTTEDKFDYFTGGAWKTVLSTTSSSGSDAEGSGYCSEGVMDYDGIHYKTVKIGNKCWMAENLKSSHYSDGTTITGDYNYNDNIYNGHAFGKLYTWAAIMNGAPSSNSNPSGVQGVCPVGWHLPSEEEWKILEFTLGMSSDEYNTIGYGRGNHFEGSRLKAGPEAHMWQHNADSAGNNQTGFSALPGGFRIYVGGFTGIYQTAFFWTCTEYDNNMAYYRELYWLNTQIIRNYDLKEFAFSVRCVRD